MFHLLCVALVCGRWPIQQSKTCELYLTAPDLPALVAAYDQAPLVRLLRDEAVKTFLVKVGAPEDFDPKTSLLEQLEKLSISAGNEDVRGLLSSLRSLSCSLTTEGDGQSPTLLAKVAFDSTEAAERAKNLAATIAHVSVPGAEAGPEPSALLSLTPDEGVACAVRDAVLLVGTGASVKEALAEPGEESSARIVELEQRAAAILGAGEGATVFRFLISGDLGSLFTSLAASQNMLSNAGINVPPALVSMLSGEQVYRMQLRGDRFVLERFSSGEEAGALGFQPIDASWLGLVPDETMLVYETSMDGAALSKRLAELELLDPGISGPLGEVLSGLGPRLLSYIFPIAGPAVPKSFAWVDLKEPERFLEDAKAVFNTLNQRIAGLSLQTSERTMRLASGEKRKVELHQVTLPQQMQVGAMLTINPTFTIVGERLLVGNSSTEVRKELERILEGGQETNSAANPFAAQGFTFPEDARSVLLFDWNRQIETLLSLARVFMGFAGEDAPFEASDIPSAEVFAKYLRSTFHFSRAVEGGTYFWHESSFGPETWLLPLAGALFSDSEGPPEPASDTPPPEGEEPPGEN